MYQSFYARSNFDKRAVVGNKNDATVYGIAVLEVRVKRLPWMWGELLDTEGDTLLLWVVFEDNDVELLVKFYHFGGMVDTPPCEVGDVHQTVDTAEVNEYPVGSDVLHHAFEDLPLFEVCDDLEALLFEFCLDECLV